MKYIWLFTASVIIHVASAQAQTPTSPPTNAAQTYNGLPLVWPPYTTVTVQLNGVSFPPGSAVESAVEQGFINNQTAYSPNDGVTYTFVNIGSSAPSLAQNTLYVTSAWLPTPTAQSNTGQWELAQWNSPTFISPAAEDYMTSGTLSINQSLVTPGSEWYSTTGVTFAASHGDSHYDGLGDCDSCPATSTIMSYQDSFPNPQITGPQASDSTVQSSISGLNYCPTQ